MTAGQACVSATRMLVPLDKKDEVLEAVSPAYAGLTVGLPPTQAAMMGPLIAAPSGTLRTIRGAGRGERGKGRRGGRPALWTRRGYYFEPTVLDLPDNANPAAQEEIFGPVLA